MLLQWLSALIGGPGRVLLLEPLETVGGVREPLGVPGHRDVETGAVVAHDLVGQPGPQCPGGPSISASGRYVAFETNGSLVAADTNQAWDVRAFG